VLTLRLESIVVEIVEFANLHTRSRPWASGVGKVTTEHRHARAKLGPTQRNHVLAVGSSQQYCKVNIAESLAGYELQQAHVDEAQRSLESTV
jgi:hypothetical protein